jgi:ADP-heptose:LPS heptosyltransferase
VNVGGPSGCEEAAKRSTEVTRTVGPTLKKVLAIRLARFGDIVLLLPALTRLKAGLPGAELTFLTGHRCSPLAAMCPAIDHVMSIDRIRMRDGPIWRALADMGRLAQEVRRSKFDLLIDCHGLRETSLLVWLSGSPQRVGLKRFDQSYLSFCFNLPPVAEDKTLHVSEMFMRIAKRFSSVESSNTPSIVVPEEAVEWARRSLPSRPFVALYLEAPVTERVWPAERFAELADHVFSQWGMDVIALSGRDGAHVIQRFLTHAHHSDQFHAFSDLSVPELAAVIGASTLLVSNDTGPMHLGPALGVQTLGIFSVGIPEHFRPAGPRDGVVHGNPIESIETRQVIRKIEEMRREV